MPPKPKPADDLLTRQRNRLIEIQPYETVNLIYASTATSISEIPRIMSLWGDNEEGMRHPSEIQEEETLYTKFTQLLGPYFFQYREFPVIEYLINIFLEQGELPARDYFREYMPDKSLDERLELIRLLDLMFRNAMGSYRGSLLHFLDVITPMMIDAPYLAPKDLLQHVPTYAPHQRQLLSMWMQHNPFTELGRYFLIDERLEDRFTAAQSAFLGELLSNGKLEEYEAKLLQELAVDPERDLTPELAVHILHVWLVYMLTCEFPEGVLINANNASKIFYCDRIVEDGIELIRNWFQICQTQMPRVITMHSLKETDVYIKIKWRRRQMEEICGLADPLPPAAEYDPLADYGLDPTPPPAEDANEEVHCMFRTREDQMVPNENGGFDVFDRKTGQPEEADSISAQIADLVTLVAAQMLAYSGYANKPKGKMFYLEVYADAIPQLTSRLVHIGTEINETGTGFKGVNRSIKAEEYPERMRLLALFVYNLVANKEQLRPAINRQNLSLAPSPKALIDKKPPKQKPETPRKRRKKGEPEDTPEAEFTPPLEQQSFF